MDLLLNALPFSLLSLEESGRIWHTTGHAPSLFGLTRGQLIGRRLADVVSGSDREEIETGVAEALRGAQVEAEVLTQADDGEPHVLVMTLAPIEEDGERVGVSALVRDVTAERALRTQVLQAERLSSVGSLVAGVAHELNNPLSAIATYATVISRSSLAGDDRSALDTIAVEARRAAQIVRNLLDFSRQRAHQHEPTNVGSVIERTVALRRYELRSAKVELTVNTESNLPAVMADGQELQQVFLNLLVNAEHAVRGRPVRQVLIQAQPVDGATVRVVVEDTGPGVPEDKLDVIFEPFYTTKPKGEGTGLGLSLSRGIVTEHHGALRAERAAGGGARFVVELPALPGVQAVAASLPGRISVMRPALAALGANVLLVDDDPANRNSLSRLLQRLGYRVSAVSNGEEALEVLEREEFTCVLSDVHMPVLDGPALYEAIAARWPELTARIAFMSGGGLEDPSLQPLVEKGCPVLQKPFELTEVRALLERFTAGPPGQPAR
jgi:PAS domain S-box-containing protein